MWAMSVEDTGSIRASWVAAALSATDRPHPITVATLLGLFVMAKLPALSTPYYWDEAAAYVTPALWLAEEGLRHALPGGHPPTRFFGHPPGIYLALAAIYRTFGHSIWITHAVAVGLATVSLFLTFRVGQMIAGPAAGLLAALLLVLSPLFFAQAGLLHGDMTVTALGLCATLFYLQGRTRLYLVAAIALVLCKETGVAIVAAISAHHLAFRRERPRRAREAVLLALPALALVAFFVVTWMATGRLLNNPYFAEHALADVSVETFRTVSGWLFERQGRWILVVVTALTVFEPPRLARRRDIALMAMLILPYWAAFSVIYFLPRYLLAAFPYVCIIAATAMVALARRTVLIPIAALIGLAAIFAREVPGDFDVPGNYETNLGYIDVVHVHAATARWLESNHANARIGAAWPLSMDLSRPALGYVAKPLHVVHVEDGREDVELLAWTAQGGPENHAILTRARAEQWHLLERFGQGAKVAVVFAPPAKSGRAARAAPPPDS